MDEWAALADLLVRERDTLLAEWRQKVRELPSARQLSTPALNDHVPVLVGELVGALRHPQRYDPAQSFVSDASVEHGIQRADNGYDIGEVVTEYGMLRSCIHTLAQIHGVPLRDGAVQTLNSVLDRGIGVAVKAFAQHCEQVERKRRDEHLAFVAHDLRTPLNAVVLASHALEQDGQQHEERIRMLAVLKRNVRQLATLVNSVLQDNRTALAQGRDQPQRRQLQLWPLVQQLIAELQPTPEFAETRLLNQTPDHLMVFADADMLRRVLEDLACQCTNCGASPRVVIAAGEHASGIWCEVRTDDGDDGGNGGNGADVREAQEAEAADTSSLVRLASVLAQAVAPHREDGRAGLATVAALLASHGSELQADDGGDTTPRTFRFALPPKRSHGN